MATLHHTSATLVYRGAIRSYEYVEHGCAISYAVNELLPFHEGTKVAGALLIALLVSVSIIRAWEAFMVSHCYREFCIWAGE